MDSYIDRLLRRLLLAGVPLWPGCFSSSSCPQNPSTIDQTIEVANPGAGADGGIGMASAAVYQRCVDTLDCQALCQEVLPFAHVDSCERVPTDGFATGEERVALNARYIPICEGRRPEGQGAAPPAARARGEAGDWLARAAFLEGVSVPAFARLGRELEAHGAPAALVRGARRAAADEVRHRRMMTALARRFGAEPAPLPERFPSHVRPLVAVAAENAAEGCVREALGAVIARVQAARAGDRAVRAGLRAIARDEARHAELAFRVRAWSHARLSAGERRRVRAAAEGELDAVAAEARAAAPSPALARDLGLPSAGLTVEIVAGMRALSRA
jgi:hypothetical protein